MENIEEIQTPAGHELALPEAPTPFAKLSTDEKLIVIHDMLIAQEERIAGALTIIEQVGIEVGPILESLQANPMFKMMGFGKKL